MSLEVKYEPQDNCVIAKLFGECPVSEIVRHYPEMIERCSASNTKKLLIDFREVVMPGETIDRYELGHNASIFARQGIKLATVATSAQLNPERFGAMVARNRGVNVVAFSDFAEAFKWLLLPGC